MTFDLQSNGGNCRDCNWIAASGEITADTPDAFRAYVEENGFYPIPVMFDSPGGNLGAAIELGRLLRAQNAVTTVGRSAFTDDPWHSIVPGGRCTSACVFAFLGGATRFTGPDELGVHQFYAPGQNVPTAATQRIMVDLVIYLIEMGISAELLSVSSRVAPDNMLFLDDAQLSELQIATSGRDTPIRLAVQQGGLVALWQSIQPNGEVDRYHQLRCSASQQAWLLTVRDTGVTGEPAMNEDMHVTVGGVRTPLDPSVILELGPVGPDLADTQITIRLPFDIRQHPQERIVFQLNDLRNFSMELAAFGTLPDAETIDALVRACGT